MQFRNTCEREGIVITCHHASVVVLKSFCVSLQILSLCLAANSWSPEPLLFYQLQIGLSRDGTALGTKILRHYFIL